MKELRQLEVKVDRSQRRQCLVGHDGEILYTKRGLRTSNRGSEPQPEGSEAQPVGSQGQLKRLRGSHRG